MFFSQGVFDAVTADEQIVSSVVNVVTETLAGVSYDQCTARPCVLAITG